MASTQETKVVHCKKEPYDIYVGRPSPWGNMYILGKHGDRAKVIALYRQWIMSEDRVAKALRAQVHLLKGKRLGCYCTPQRCHADILKELADAT